MFPYILIFPIWIAVSIVWPLIHSLHALHTNSTKDLKLWLFYWAGYALLSFLMSFSMVSFVVQIPFSIIGSLLFDIYYEMQIIVVFGLILPKFRMLEKVLALFETHLDDITQLLDKNFGEIQEKVQGGVQQAMGALKGKAE